MKTIKNINNTNFHADIEKNKSIRIYGEIWGHAVDKTFHVGDKAEYGSYNLHYIGEITGIGEKTVTILENPNTTNKKRKRLRFHEFGWRNRNSIEEKEKTNSELMYTL